MTYISAWEASSAVSEQLKNYPEVFSYGDAVYPYQKVCPRVHQLRRTMINPKRKEASDEEKQYMPEMVYDDRYYFFSYNKSLFARIDTKERILTIYKTNISVNAMAYALHTVIGRSFGNWQEVKIYKTGTYTVVKVGADVERHMFPEMEIREENGELVVDSPPYVPYSKKVELSPRNSAW